MAAMPWYLLAAGIILVVVGFLIAGMSGPGRSTRTIDPRMKDDEVARLLRRDEGAGLSTWLILLGLLCIAVSVVWRIARIFI